MCLPLDKKCNGVIDCSDESDEIKCNNSSEKTFDRPNSYVTLCTENEFRCWNNLECIRKRFVCDGRNDCLDGSDEKNCTGKG